MNEIQLMQEYEAVEQGHDCPSCGAVWDGEPDARRMKHDEECELARMLFKLWSFA